MAVRWMWFVISVTGLFASAAWAEADPTGKLTVFAAGREQAVFEKSSAKFEKKFPKVRMRFLDTEGGDALAAVSEGKADVAVIGRQLTPEDKGLGGTVVGWEGIAVMVNASNRVNEVNLAQLSDIFSGKAKTWDELGGLEHRITVIEREPSKGVRPYLETLLNLTNMADGKGIVEPDKEAVKVVAGNLNAVSYLNLGTALSNVTMGVPVRLLSIGKIEPEPSNVSTGAYPLRRPIIIVTKEQPSPAAKAFIEFMLDKDGQKIIQEEEYTPMFVTK